MSNQQTEAEDLRRQLSDAGAALLHANEDRSDKLNKIVAQEKAQAAEDRAGLLSQIATLIQDQGNKQDKRLDDTISNIREEIAASNETFTREQSAYKESMDQWVLKSQEVQSDLQKSREQVKQRIKGDWAVSKAESVQIRQS